MAKLIGWRKSEAEVENLILTGLIVNNNFIKRVFEVYDKEYFLNEYIKIISLWCIQYYRKYNKAPKGNIKFIYQKKKRKFDNKSLSENIAALLVKISSEYESGKYGEEEFNYEYALDVALEYFRNRSIELMNSKVELLINAGRQHEAEKLFREYREIQYKTYENTNPFTVEAAVKYFKSLETKKALRLEGAAGEYLGTFKKGWLVSVMAPEKTGKSFVLLEMIFQAMQQKKKVIIFSFEMSEEEYNERLYKRITATPTESDLNEIKGDYILVPSFDCALNQSGKCRKYKFSSRKNLVDKKTGQVYKDFVDVEDYSICTHCRRNSNKRLQERYKPKIWHEKVKLKEYLAMTKLKKKFKSIQMQYGKRLRVKSYPPYGASLDDIEDYLNELEMNEGFIPDVVGIDYLDITGDLQGEHDIRARVDAKWKRAKNLAATRKILLITPDQSNKSSRKSVSVTVMDTTEDKRKDAHVDVKIGMSQTKEEYNRGYYRLIELLHRHKRINKAFELGCLWSLELGQPMLDCEWVKLPDEKKKEK